jgi:hypothetical protein
MFFFGFEVYFENRVMCLVCCDVWLNLLFAI